MICFLSYAGKNKQRDNADDPYFDVFLKDLRQNLADRSGDQDPVFVDSEGIEPGAVWPAVLTDALRTCRVFAYCHSPQYFQRPDCGKEWTVFWQRMVAAGKVAVKANEPSPMIPIHWIPTTHVASIVPPQLSDLQFTLPGMDLAYAKDGMQRLAKFTKEPPYIKGMEILADHILKCADEVSVPPAKSIEDFRKISPAFPIQTNSATSSTSSNPSNPNSGPPARYAQFIFVAAPPEQLKPFKLDLSPYDPAGGELWKPFPSESDQSAALIAMNAAGNTKLIFEKVAVALDPEQFRAKLIVARNEKKPVVVLIDVWTMRVPAYNAILQEFDSGFPYNCVPIMPWNLKDKETIAAQILLRDFAEKTFVSLLTNGKYKPLLESVTTVDLLRTQIEAALTELKNTIIKKTPPPVPPSGPPVSMTDLSVAGAGADA